MELNKENFDAIIIGSGIGGLVTVSNWQRGAQVLVLEKYIIPGGEEVLKEKVGALDVGASMIFGFGEKVIPIY